MPYPSPSLYPGSWYPGAFGPDSVSVADQFDATSPALAVYTSSAALATLDSTPALPAYASAASFESTLTGDYGDGAYGQGLYGTGNGTDYGLFDLTDAAIAAFLSTPAMASYDTPEPAL